MCVFVFKIQKENHCHYKVNSANGSRMSVTVVRASFTASTMPAARQPLRMICFPRSVLNIACKIRYFLTKILQQSRVHISFATLKSCTLKSCEFFFFASQSISPFLHSNSSLGNQFQHFVPFNFVAFQSDSPT